MRCLRIALLALPALLAHAGTASATTTEAVNLRAGPLEAGEGVGVVWMAKCPAGQRLVGIRQRADEQILSVQAICAPLRTDQNGLRWAAAPRVPEPPPPPPKPRIVTRQVEREVQGTVLRADSMGVSRLRGSRAVLITVSEPVTDEQIFPMPQPVVDFRDGGRTTDLMCPIKQFVKGLRVGSEDGQAGPKVVALQLLCSDTTGRMLATIGAWPADKPALKARKKDRKRKPAAAPSLRIQRIECSGTASNPHDGAAASTVFGTLDDGRVQTIGLSCAREIDPRGSERTLYAAARRAAESIPRLFGWQTTYETPHWIDGAQLAACAPGALDKACTQESADRFCVEAQGYDRATAYRVGRFAKDSVAATGEHCARGACRAFAAITCGFGEPAGQGEGAGIESVAAHRRN